MEGLVHFWLNRISRHNTEDSRAAPVTVVLPTCYLLSSYSNISFKYTFCGKVLRGSPN